MEPIKIIAMIDRSAGNDTVGEIWTETKIFEIDTPIFAIYKWARDVTNSDSIEHVKANIKLSIAQ